MKLDVIQKRNFAAAIRIMLAGLAIAFVYPAFRHGFKESVHFINAFFIGLFGGAFVSYCELVLFQNLKKPRAFIPRVLFKTAIYFIGFALFIPAIILVCESIYYQRGLKEHFDSPLFQDFIFKKDFGIILIYALFFLLVVIFTREISSKLGQGVLWNYITGKYHRPRTEKRLFMFIDIRNSTRIAEKLGDLEFHSFVHTFIQDLTPVILAYRGLIFRYVGDQIGITWNEMQGFHQANCLRLFLSAQNTILRNREKYLEAYGIVPKFVACLHFGPIVVGELGDVKSQIVYVGEAIHVLGQMERQFKHSKEGTFLIISDEVAGKMSIPGLYDLQNLGQLDLEVGSFNISTLIEKKMD